MVNMDVRIQQRNKALILNLPISHVQGWVDGLFNFDASGCWASSSLLAWRHFI